MQKSHYKNDLNIWFIILGVWLVYFCFGFTVNSVAPLVPFITEDLNITYKEMGLILGAWQFIYIFFALPAGIFVDKYGLKISIFISAIIITLSLLFRGFSESFFYMWLAVALFGVGGPLISVSAPKTALIWSNQKNRIISMGILLTGPFIGGICSLSLTNTIMMPLMNNNWNYVFYSYSLLPLLSAILWLVIYNVFWNKDFDNNTQAIKSNISHTLKLLINKKRYILVIFVGIIIMYLVHGISGWMPKILSSKGINISYASNLATIPVIIGIISALSVPRFSNNKNRLKIIFLLFINVMLSMQFIKYSESYLYMFGLCFIGISTGSLMTLLISHLSDTKDISFSNIGIASGLFYSIIQIGGVLGPYSIGIIYDLTQDFNNALTFNILVTLLSFLPLYLLAKLKNL